MCKQKQGIPVIHLENLTSERERNLLIQTATGFEKTGVAFALVDRDKTDKNNMLIMPFNNVADTDIQAIADELFNMFDDVQKVGVINNEI